MAFQYGFAGVGSGLGVGGQDSQSVPWKLLEAREPVMAFLILCLSGKCIERCSSVGTLAGQPSPVQCPRRPGETPGQACRCLLT